VDGFPTLLLFIDGKFIEEYPDDNETNLFIEYLRKVVKKYNITHTKPKDPPVIPLAKPKDSPERLKSNDNVVKPITQASQPSKEVVKPIEKVIEPIEKVFKPVDAPIEKASQPTKPISKPAEPDSIKHMPTEEFLNSKKKQSVKKPFVSQEFVDGNEPATIKSHELPQPDQSHYVRL
jgi:hypothetical protein